jgi:hypothetical protein
MTNPDSKQFDAVFVFPGYTYPQEKVPSNDKSGRVERFIGKHIKKPRPTNSSGLLFDTRLKDIAAVQMAKSGQTDTIWTMSRKTRSWMNKSNAALQADHIRGLLAAEKRGISIKREEESWDTGSEVKAVGKISQEENYGHVAIVVTDDQTKKRVESLIAAGGDGFPNYELKDIGDVLLDPAVTKSEMLRDVAKNYESSWFSKFWAVRDFTIRSLEKVPFLRKSITEVADASRPNE